MRRIKLLLVIAPVILLMSRCAYNDANVAIDCSTAEVTFNSTVQPVVTANCSANSSCHGTGSNSGPGVLFTYAQIYKARTEIKSSVSNGSMPKDDALTSDERNTILCWIENGAQNN